MLCTRVKPWMAIGIFNEPWEPTGNLRPHSWGRCSCTRNRTPPRSLYTSQPSPWPRSVSELGPGSQKSKPTTTLWMRVSTVEAKYSPMLIGLIQALAYMFAPQFHKHTPQTLWQQSVIQNTTQDKALLLFQVAGHTNSSATHEFPECDSASAILCLMSECPTWALDAESKQYPLNNSSHWMFIHCSMFIHKPVEKWHCPPSRRWARV